MDKAVHGSLKRRRALRKAASALLLAGLAASPGRAAEQGIRPAVTAEIRVEPSSPGERLAPGSFVRITVAYRDAVTGLAPPGLSPAAWIRRLDTGRPACERAAQNFRVTRALTRDDVPLFGAWIAVEDTEGSISIVDPKIDFQGSGMVSLKALGERPRAVAQLASKQQLAVSLPERGTVAAFSLPDLEEAWTFEPLARPGALVETADGALFVGEDATGSVAKLASGKVAGRWQVGPGPVSLTAVRASARFGPSVVAVAADGAALWLAGADVREVAALPSGALGGTAGPVAWPGGIVYADAAGRLQLRFRDSPSVVRTLATPISVEGMSLDAKGRYLLAWSNTALRAELIDLAFGKPVQGFALAGPITNAVFSGDTLFCGHSGIAAVSIVDLAPLRTGTEALVRTARIDPTAAAPSRGEPRVVVRAIGDSDNVVAFREGDGTLFVMHGGAGHASPIVGTIALRGGLPAAVSVLDRGMLEVAPGVFESQARLPDRGPLEIVATTGVGGVTSCERVPLDAADDAGRPSEPRLSLAGAVQPRAGQQALVRIRLDGMEARPPAVLQFLATALPSGAWRALVRARLAADGTYTLPMTFPAAGDYPLIPIGPGLGDRVAPLIIEVRS